MVMQKDEVGSDLHEAGSPLGSCATCDDVKHARGEFLATESSAMLVRFAVGASCTVYRSPTLPGPGQLPEPAKTHRTMSLYRQALHGKNVETCKKC